MHPYTDMVRQTAYDIHHYLAHGHLEKIYENALFHRLRKQGIPCERQKPIRVTDEDGTLLGTLIPDLVVDGGLLVEIKAVQTLHAHHIAQLLGYLRAGEIKEGLLINFGHPTFQIRKFIQKSSP